MKASEEALSSTSARSLLDAETRAALPAVTVLMGVHNGLPRLERAMRSVLDQTFTDFELLIIDDASTDGTAEWLQKAAQQDTRIRSLRMAVNEGLGSALRRGVQMARGPLIARMDADDVSVPERLRKQVDFLEQHPDIDIVGSFALDVDEDGKVLQERRVPTSHRRIVELIWTCPLIHPTVVFRRQSVIDAGSYSAAIRRRQDYELWFRCVRAGLGFANIPEPLVHYLHTRHTLRRNHLPAMWRQARMGWAGCRIIGARPAAYIGVAFPVLEALLPSPLRAKLIHVKRRLDPRQAS